MVGRWRHPTFKFRIVLLSIALVLVYSTLWLFKFRIVSYHKINKTAVEFDVSTVRKTMNDLTSDQYTMNQKLKKTNGSGERMDISGATLSYDTDNATKAVAVITFANIGETNFTRTKESENKINHDLKTFNSVKYQNSNKFPQLSKHNYSKSASDYQPRSKAVSDITQHIHTQQDGSIYKINEEKTYTNKFKESINISPRLQRENSITNSDIPKPHLIQANKSNPMLNMNKDAITSNQERLNSIKMNLYYTPEPLQNNKVSTFANRNTSTLKMSMVFSKDLNAQLMFETPVNENRNALNARQKLEAPVNENRNDRTAKVKFETPVNENRNDLNEKRKFETLANENRKDLNAMQKFETPVNESRKDLNAKQKLKTPAHDNRKTGLEKSLQQHANMTSASCKFAYNALNKTKIGILIPSSTRNIQNPLFENLTLVNTSLPSLYKTIEAQYIYRIYIGIDDGDFLQTVQDKIVSLFDCVIPVIAQGKNYVKCVNTIADRAYKDGMDYLVRINDDTMFVSPNWTSIAINKLKEYQPANIGVVGPTCNEGNTDILTHDMVHRTHLEIFDFYYPPYLENWWTDDWITKIYEPNKSTKLASWIVKHVQFETRYEVDKERQQWSKTLIQYDRKRLQTYIGCSCSCTANIWVTLPIALVSLAFKF